MTTDHEAPTADEVFERLAARLMADPGVSLGTGFGASRGLRVEGRIFAIFGAHDLVVKLPKTRVDQLVASGTGVRFDPGHGRVMKEWISIPAHAVRDWERYADDALAFVRSSARSLRGS